MPAQDVDALDVRLIDQQRGLKTCYEKQRQDESVLELRITIDRVEPKPRSCDPPSTLM